MRRRRTSKGRGIKGRPTGRGAGAAGHRDGRLSCREDDSPRRGTDAPAEVRADVLARAQSARTESQCPTAVCVDVLKCVVQRVCELATTEVDSGGVVRGTTEVDSPADRVHESPTTEVESGVDREGYSRRGDAVPCAAAAAGGETFPPPRQARHPFDRADARPHPGWIPGEAEPREVDGLIYQGSEEPCDEIRGTAAQIGQDSSEDVSLPSLASQPDPDQPTDASLGEHYGSDEGEPSCEPPYESSQPLLAARVPTRDRPFHDADSLIGTSTPTPDAELESDLREQWCQSCGQPASSSDSQSVSPRGAEVSSVVSLGTLDPQVCLGDGPTLGRPVRQPLTAQDVSRRELVLASSLSRLPAGDESWSSLQRGAASFLAHIFTRLRRRWNIAQIRRRWPCLWRPTVICRCRHGLNLAPRGEFEAQAELAEKTRDWDREHVRLLRRLDSGARVLILDLFCAAGGVSEGFRRMTATSFGVDDTDQEFFTARFGIESFEQGDALDRDRLRRLVRNLRPTAIWASPPCEASSTLTFGGQPSVAQRLIAATRDALVETGLPFVIENVRGAASELLPHAITLRGQEYGLETERPRLFEAGGGPGANDQSFLGAGRFGSSGSVLPWWPSQI